MRPRVHVLILILVFAASSAGFAQSGFFRYTAGPVKAKVAATQTAATTFPEGGFLGLPRAVLQYTVPAGTTDVFNVSFTAECRLFGAGPGDNLRIRVIDSVTINGALVSRTRLEPFDGFQAFCSADGYATHTGKWVERAGAGLHTIVLEFAIVDELPDDLLSASIDDWTFELVVHD